MPYRVQFNAHAERVFAKLPREVQVRLAPRILALADSPRPGGCRKLEGADAYRIRVGDYRIVFDISDLSQTVTITDTAHRSKVYKRR